MKKFLIFGIFIILSASAFAEQIFEMKNGYPYIYFSNSEIKSIKSDNPTAISAQRVTTFDSKSTQVIFYPKKCGVANVQIVSASGEHIYKVVIKNSAVKSNNTFVEIDVPGIVQK
ncbi:MAG: hypothetical protein K6C94_03840 [Candidatus Gastranaerophilales bacterium]|nr:hypothetical protein [Candidatus Gastranaerophilales bacterium]